MDALPALLRRFGLSPSAVVAVEGGLQSRVWRVEDGGAAFTVRRHEPPAASVAGVASELAWLSALHARTPGLSPAPVPLSDGTVSPHVAHGPLGEVEAIWTVMGWVDGRPLGRLPDPREARLVGQLLATMHGVGRSWQPPPGFSRPRYDAALFGAAADELLGRMADQVAPADAAAVQAGLAAACRTLDALWSAGDVVIIHADPHDGNLLWSPDRAGPAAIDFGRCGWGPPALDLAMAQHYVTPDMAAEILAGYAATVDLGEEGEASLPGLRFLAWLENLSILSRFPAEASGVREELPYLAEAGRSLVP